MNIIDKIKGHPRVDNGTAFAVLFTMGFCHMLNDMIQSVVPAMYPLMKENFGFTFVQIGIITLVYQMVSSVFQPFVGLYADKHPKPYSLAAGMCFTLAGLLILRTGLSAFERKLRGYTAADAVLTGLETRTSSPVRLERGENLQCTALPGLYPCGEGAGYAGGIVSAAVDGLRCARALMATGGPQE